MDCKHVRPLLHAYIDGELDLVNSLELEEHLRGCQDCSREYRELVELKAALQGAALFDPAPAELRARIRSAVRKTDRAAAGRPVLPWRMIATAVVLVGVLLAVVGLTQGWFSGAGTAQDTRLAEEVQSAHVRSMMASHLTDVTTSDQHTVKPWFGGKLDFSPPVVDLAAQGYPLVGGRLDYLDGHPVAALVYQHNKHFINLFIWPATAQGTTPKFSVDNGYNLSHWDQAGMTYWAISDMAAAELQDFTHLVQQNFK